MMNGKLVERQRSTFDSSRRNRRCEAIDSDICSRNRGEHSTDFGINVLDESLNIVRRPFLVQRPFRQLKHARTIGGMNESHLPTKSMREKGSGNRFGSPNVHQPNLCATNVGDERIKDPGSFAECGKC